MTSAKNDMTFGLETNLTVILSSFHCRKVYCSQYKEFLQQYNDYDYHTHLKKITKMTSTELLFAFL